MNIKLGDAVTERKDMMLQGEDAETKVNSFT